MNTIFKIPFITFFILTTLLAQSCSKNHCVSSKDGELKNLTDLDGCGWVIVLDDGKKLEPTNLNKFDIALVDGKKISVRYKESNAGGSICMVGEIIDIKCIKEK